MQYETYSNSIFNNGKPSTLEWIGLLFGVEAYWNRLLHFIKIHNDHLKGSNNHIVCIKHLERCVKIDSLFLGKDGPVVMVTRSFAFAMLLSLASLEYEGVKNALNMLVFYGGLGVVFGVCHYEEVGDLRKLLRK